MNAAKVLEDLKRRFPNEPEYHQAVEENSERISWSAEEVDNKLHYIMENIHENCVKYGTEEDGYVNYVKGANIAGFMKVAKAMMAQGIV